MNKYEELGKLISENKVIPFVGAGASIEQLGIDWDEICDSMASEISIINKNNINTAQIYVEKKGKEAFSKFLKEKLEIIEFDDKKGTVHLFLLSLNCYYYYTTNQDNIFEKCLQKYQRNFNLLHTIDSFTNHQMNYVSIYKFHGDLNYPETIVFTTSDYEKRNISTNDIKTYNPLDLRLISDAITKSFLFIGYSFRDPNIIEIFIHLKNIFSGSLPKSYLIQFEGNQDFEKKMKEEFEVECIDPKKYFPNETTLNAFNMFLSELGECTYTFDLEKQMEDMFPTSERNFIPIVYPIYCEYFSKYLLKTNDTTVEIIENFRKTYDGKNIPREMQETTKESIISIINQIETKEEVFQISGCLFNLNILPVYTLNIMLEYYYAIRNVKIEDLFDQIHVFNINMKQFSEEYKILAVAMTFNRIIDEGNKVSDNLLGFTTSSVHSSENIKDLTEEQRNYVQYWFDIAFKNAKYSNPLKSKSIGFGISSYNDILKGITNNIPKAIKDKPK